jgi:uncharacterized protein YjbI with pentapeptide repeats
VIINLSASNLPKSDFAGVIAQKGNFQASALRGSDFTGADLTGSSFRGSDVREANFAGANLTDIVMACRGRYTRAVYAGLDLDRGDCRIVRKIGGWRNCSCLSDSLPAVN